MCENYVGVTLAIVELQHTEFLKPLFLYALKWVISRFCQTRSHVICRKGLDPLLPYCIITFLHPVTLYTHYTYALLTMKQCHVQIVHSFHKTDLS